MDAITLEVPEACSEPDQPGQVSEMVGGDGYHCPPPGMGRPDVWVDVSNNGAAGMLQIAFANQSDCIYDPEGAPRRRRNAKADARRAGLNCPWGTDYDEAPPAICARPEGSFVTVCCTDSGDNRSVGGKLSQAFRKLGAYPGAYVRVIFSSNNPYHRFTPEVQNWMNRNCVSVPSRG